MKIPDFTPFCFSGMSYSFDEEDEMSEEENMDDESLSPMERLMKYKDSHLLLQR